MKTLILAAMATVATVVVAQESTSQTIEQRIEELERRVAQLERHVAPMHERYLRNQAFQKTLEERRKRNAGIRQVKENAAKREQKARNQK